MNCDNCNSIRFQLSRTQNNIVDILCCSYSETSPLCSIPFDELDTFDFSVFEGKKPHVFCTLHNTECFIKKSKISKVFVSLDKSCNLSCKRCIIKQTNNSNCNRETKNIYFNFLDKLKNNHNLNSIGLTTIGEPFFYKEETFNFLKSLKGTSIRSVDITTNANLLDEKDIYKLSNISKYSDIDLYIGVSIDSIKKQVYEKLREGASFEKVINNILLLKKYSLLNFIIYGIQKENISEIPYVSYFFKNLGIDKVQYLAFYDSSSESLNMLNGHIYNNMNNISNSKQIIFKNNSYYIDNYQILDIIDEPPYLKVICNINNSKKSFYIKDINTWSIEPIVPKLY